MILNQLCPLKRIQYEERRKRVQTRKQDKSKFQLFASWRLYVSQHLKEKVGILDQKSIKPLIFWHLHFAPHWMWNKEREYKQENRTSQNPSYLPVDAYRVLNTGWQSERKGRNPGSGVKPLIFWHSHFALHRMWNKERGYKQGNRTSQTPPDVDSFTFLNTGSETGKKEQGQGSWVMSQTSGCLSGARTRRLAWCPGKSPTWGSLTWQLWRPPPPQPQPQPQTSSLPGVLDAQFRRNDNNHVIIRSSFFLEIFGKDVSN